MKKTINYFVATGLVAALLTVGACSKKDTTLPAIGGFNSSADIETSNLVAFWSFENNFNESIQNLAPAPSTSAPTFVAGVKGQAYQGGGDSFVNYPIGTLGGVQSLTVSMWFKQPASPVNNTTSAYIAGEGPQGMVFMYNAAAWNTLEIAMEPFTPKSGDSLKMDAGFNVNTSALSGDYAGQQEGVISTVYAINYTNKWVHFVMTYDASTSSFTVYNDGAVIGTGTAWSNVKTPGSAIILSGGTGDAGSVPIGNLNLNSPLGLIIGGFPQVLNNANATYNPATPQPWTGNWQGAMDEIRIYKSALSATEVGSLYQLELAGR